MKLLVFTLAVVTGVIAAPQSSPPPSVIPGLPDIPGALVSSFSEVTRQINSLQSVLSELNGQLQRMIETSTRLVTGKLNSENSSPVPGVPSVPGLPSIASLQGNPASGLIGTAFSTVQQLTNQLLAVQRSIQEITFQLERVVQTSARIITGPALYADNGLPSAPNVAETALNTLREWTNSLQGMNQVLREMNEQWNRIVATGTRMITGKLQSGSLPNVPGSEIVNTAVNSISQQVNQMQRVLNEFSVQLTRMLESGTRLVSGLQAEGTTPLGSSPGDAALAVVNALTQQFTQVQRVLSDLNGQLNRMIQTSTRIVG